MIEETSLFEVRGEKNNFKDKKDNLIHSLCEVENFLCCCHKAAKCGEIVKFVKRACKNR